MKAIDLIKKADEKILAKAKQYEASKQVNAKANYKRELEAAIAEYIRYVLKQLSKVHSNLTLQVCF